jgi:UDP-N-acetylmuramoyl-L-alanyl-D-glutamate--2,6-diaminopimelate ligase
MNLKELLAGIGRVSPFGPLDKEITALTVDSRTVTEGCLFAAIRGDKTDGHDFIDAAREKGAAAIMAERDVPERWRDTWLRVPDSRVGIAEAADRYYLRPSDEMLLCGITGTNGKTTTAFLLHHLLTLAKGRCGLIGTVKYDTGLGFEPSSHTTPDWIAVQRLLSEMRSNGCAGVAMEVSSHALQQSRVHGIRFNAGVFTNLTQDHLDYHGSMENYFAAKAKLFEHLTTQGDHKKPAAVLNIDDTYGRRLAHMFDGKLNIVKFGMGMAADFRASDVRTGMQGTQFTLVARGRTFLVRLPLIGRFNVYNALAAIGSAWAMGLNLRETVTHMARAPQVPGRMQSVAENKPFRVFVDYAHTPDALENALRTLKDLGPRRLITVFGCGGDRDRSKRPKMGAVSGNFSNWTIVTSDNPRSEVPEKILDDIRAGMRAGQYESIVDRKAAIAKAISLAGGGDIVLIAGKGHEQGQTFAHETVPFDDVKVAQSVLREWKLPDRGETDRDRGDRK